MDRATQGVEMLKIGAAPDYSVGSVNAVTDHVIWVVGTQKIVKNTDEGFKRIYEYVLPLESERMNKAYNLTTGSFVSKVVIINREIKPNRITLIFVGEKLGF